MAKERSRLSDSIWTFFTETIRFIVVPLVLIDLVRSSWPQLSTAFIGNIVEYTLFFGGLVVAASTLEVMNKPGTFKRMFFGMSGLAFLCLWLFVVFGGGVASFTYHQYFVKFDMSKVVYIMLIGISLRGLLVMRTYSDNRHLIAEPPKPAAKSPKRATRKPATPAFGAMSQVAYQVTGDDDVGSSPRPPMAASEPSGTCPVCGAEVSPGSRSCSQCGAWM